jgi:uroporphyrinogen decarboxylase
LTARENYFKAVRFERPDYIPMTFVITSSCWNNYPHEALFDLMEEHKFLFPDFKRLKDKFAPKIHPVARKGIPYKDDWGCIWETTEDGITGTVTGHPLADWNSFEIYQAPDPNKVMGIGPIDWAKVELDLKEARGCGKLVQVALRHGHTFLQLCDIRGYENLIFDMADHESRLYQLIDMVEQFNLGLVNNYIKIGVDAMGYAEDLGMQKGPMLSPQHFRKYIKPSYQRLMKPARDAGVIVHMHSDGDIRSLVDDIIEGGVDVINLQDLVNGIDWISEKFSGKTCVELDIDRQSVTVHGTPKQIDKLIEEEVRKIGCPQDGLTMIYGLYPGVPLKNVKAVMDSMERYSLYYS